MTLKFLILVPLTFLIFATLSHNPIQSRYDSSKITSNNFFFELFITSRHHWEILHAEVYLNKVVAVLKFVE